MSEHRKVLSVTPDGRLVLPWCRQQGESRLAFAAFELYRDGAARGARSIRGVARELGKSRQLLERWSVRWRWVERCERYDSALDRLRVARRFAEAEERARLLTRGGPDEIDRLLADGEFMLYAALVQPLDDLVGLVGGEVGSSLDPTTEGLGAMGTGASLEEEHATNRSRARGWARQRPTTTQGGRY